MGRGLLDLTHCVWEPNPILRPKLGATGHSVKASWEELGHVSGQLQLTLASLLLCQWGKTGAALGPHVWVVARTAARGCAEGLCFSQVSRGLI